MFSLDHIVKLRKVALADIEAEQIKLKMAREAHRKRASIVIKARRASVICASAAPSTAPPSSLDGVVAQAEHVKSASLPSLSPLLGPADDPEVHTPFNATKPNMRFYFMLFSPHHFV
jgi:hypothetical protein